MATQYASLQPSKSNRLKNIAIVGASGNVGSHIVSALVERNECNITAISRTDSKGSFHKDIKIARVDYEKPDTLVAALQGHDALIITMSVFAPPGTQAKIIRAAAAAGVTWIMPNEFGMYNTDEAQNDTIGPGKAEDRALIESSGMSWTGLTCGFGTSTVSLGQDSTALTLRNAKSSSSMKERNRSTLRHGPWLAVPSPKFFRFRSYHTTSETRA
tara:strand:- start:6103 stop:6747 length:645 start_codon:yes stop_codon:yes gene_type:complete